MERRATSSAAGGYSRSDGDDEDMSLSLNEIRAQARSRKKKLWMQSLTLSEIRAQARSRKKNLWMQSLSLNEIRAQAHSRKKKLWMQSDIRQESVEYYQDAKLGKTEDPPLKKEVHSSKKSSTNNRGRTRNRWSVEEDKMLFQMVNKHGTKSWQTVAHALPNRNASQCRIRWKYSLNPAINKEAWSLQEELKLIGAHQVYGDNWLEMVKHFPGRTNHGLREYWRRHLKGKLDAYLAFGLLEQVPDLHENQSSGPLSIQSDGPKDTEVSPADRGRLVLQPSSISKVGNVDTTEGNSSNDFIDPKSLDIRPVKFSERIVSKSQQRARARRKLDFLSTPTGAAAETPAISQMPTSGREQMSPSACSVSSPNLVSSECVDTILSRASSDHPSDVHSSGTPDPFVSLEQREDYLSDLLDMSYCDSLMIDPSSPPHEDGFM